MTMFENGYYPPGAQYDPDAPYNQKPLKEKEFNITVVTTLSKDFKVLTDTYDLEDDKYYKEVNVITDDVDWKSVFDDNGHLGVMELLKLLKGLAEKEVERNKREIDTAEFYKHVIEECSNWIEDENEIIES